MPLFLSISGILIACCINLSFNFLFMRLKKLNFFLFLIFLISKKWYWDILYNRFITYPLLNFGYLISFKNLDKGFIEILGPYSLIKLVPMWSRVLANLQTGQIIHYIFFMVFGLCMFLAVIFSFSSLIDSYLMSIFIILTFFN